MKNMKCPVCNNIILNKQNFQYRICKQCYWEYDPLQVDKPDYSGGANVLSLNEYKKVYEKLIADNPNFSCKNKQDLEMLLQATKQK